MKHLFTITVLFLLSLVGNAQSFTIKGSLVSDNNEPIVFANVLLLSGIDSTLVKASTSDLDGVISIVGISNGVYYLKVSYIGYDDLTISDLRINNTDFDLGSQTMITSSVQLEEAVVTARRAIVEIKPDRTIFNVQGTINSTGDNGLGLLRKAPGVLVDNNNNITVLSRSGVLIYIDGKRLPLAGDDLVNYLQNLSAEQIDRMDIITNPGAKYEAQGNAGIIDIRLKKDKNLGSNGIVNGTFSQGQLASGNLGISGNFRNKNLNSFASVGHNNGKSFHKTRFENSQRGIFLLESDYTETYNSSYNYRWGTDFFITTNQTFGFLISGGNQNGDVASDNSTEISDRTGNLRADSILVAENTSESIRSQNTFNLNYAYNNGKTTVNIDADYGRYRNDKDNVQPNQYFTADRNTLLSGNITEYSTPVEIDIYTFKIDVEKPFAKGNLGFGSKFSKVNTDNTFLFYNVINNRKIQNDFRSNQFDYDENVYAGYVNYNRTLNDKWSLSTGLRLEITDAVGDLTAFLPELEEPAVNQDYTNLFPTIGITYQMKPEHAFSANFGRRINRPDYNVLNPFKEQISELSFSKGNSFLKPEIVNNFELGYTLKYRYNFKVSYSKTTDQITRLIGPDESDPRANFINWDNLASQTLISGSITAPVDIKSWWSAFTNINGGYINNQADYGDGAVVDLQSWTYNIFQQHTFKLPGEISGEISGWFAGPGVWGGVFEYETSYSLNLGLQKKFLNDNMNVRLSVQDITYQSGWTGFSSFNGLSGYGNGNYDSRRASISMSYAFGNNQVKSRKRNTGIEDESSRVN